MVYKVSPFKLPLLSRVSRYARTLGLMGVFVAQLTGCQIQVPGNPVSRNSVSGDGSEAPVDPGKSPDLGTNLAPEASAGSNFSVGSGTQVTIQGQGKDPEGGQLQYLWVKTRGPDIGEVDMTTPNLVFIAPVVPDSTPLSFRLTVSDDKGAIGVDTVTVTLLPVGATPTSVPPVVDAGRDIAISAGATGDVLLHATATDADGIIASYQWQQLGGISVTLKGSDTANLAFAAPTVDSALLLSFKVTVTDDSGLSAMDIVNVRVTPTLSCASSCTGDPRILFTDLVAGPTSGGENNNGAYLNIFGINFGPSSGLGSNTRVYINGAEVADYKLLGLAKAQPFAYSGVVLQQLSVQVGSLGGLGAGASGVIKVVVGDVSSNTDLSFMNQPGDIIYVSLGGSDTTGDGSFGKPYRYVQNTNRSNPAWTRLGPGDTIVMRGGSWSDVGWDNRFVRIRQDLDPTEPNGVVGNGYLAFQAYPGESVVINLSEAAGNYKGAFSGPSSVNHAHSHYVVFSGFTVHDDDATKPSNVGAGGPFNSQTSGDHWRVINNEMTVRIGEVQQKAAGISGGFRNATLMGNFIHDIEGISVANATYSESLVNHGMYFDNYTNNLEIAYNVVKNVSGGSGIQFFGNLGLSCGLIPGDNSICPLDRLSVHHNVVDTVTGKHGLNLAAVTVSGEVYNNVVMHVKQAGLRLGSYDFSNMKVVFNSFFDVAYGHTRGAVFVDGTVVAPDTVYVENNIIYISPNSPSTEYYSYYNGSGSDTGVNMKKNVWYGKGNAPPAKDVGGVYGDPAFLSTVSGAEDLRINSASAAYGAGGSGVYVPKNDMLMNVRPGVLDAGAFQVAR